MNNEDKKKISRRDFFKIAGAAGAVTTGLAACGNKRTDSSAATNTEVPTDAMTYRTLTGDRVSLLGYGCMRWPRATRITSPRRCRTIAFTGQGFEEKSCTTLR